ncbi:ferric reductase like transmembrane component-domain-containing protein, partial [Aspergillus unguis]
MDMDMDMPSGLPWLDRPVMLHSSRADNCTLTPEQCVYRSGHWRYWYNADRVYALNTVYFLCATIGVFTIAHFTSKYAPSSIRQNSLWRKLTAAGRFLSYRGFRVPGVGSGYWAVTASLGVLGLLLAGFVFFMGMTLGPKPYYWPNTDTVSYGGSPPIATRAGWMAVAMLPFILVLSTKANLITALTGVPHEKLQIYHHWLSYAMFVLALVHTFPFIVYNIGKGTMVSEWKSTLTYWTGVAALIPQAWLTFMSVPWIRNRYYEFFKATHFVIALLFILFFFFHCDFRLSSWDYFIAAGSLYVFSLGSAWVRTHLINGRHTATLTLLPNNLLQIKIRTILNWKPGQHVFIRFASLKNGLALHSLTAHPFTICSVAHDIKEQERANEMVFFVKPKGGITGRLAALAERTPGASVDVLLEGPYGGVEGDVLQRAEQVVVVSGGSGGGFSLGVFEAGLQTFRQLCLCGEKANRKVRVVYACQTEDFAQWYREEVGKITGRYGVDGIDVHVSIHVTSSASPSLKEKDVENALPAPKSLSAGETIEPLSSSSSDAPDPQTVTFEKGRPDLSSIISTATAASGQKNTAVFACGPTSMLHDVRNAAADAQHGILHGGGQGEVYLNSESFSW